MRLGIRMPGHAYILPDGAEVGGAALLAASQGGELCVVTERAVQVRVQARVSGKWEDVGDVEMVESVFTPLG